MPGGEALRRAGLAPVALEAKEGLALTNGTAPMAALGSLAVIEAENALLRGRGRRAEPRGAARDPVGADLRIHAARPHPRQNECAAHLRGAAGRPTFVRPPDHPDVQDAYTLRCIPQVHGVPRCHWHARWVVQIELNSATDNPLIFWEPDGTPIAISGGELSRRTACHCLRLPGPGAHGAGQHWWSAA